ncbi:uncharacterized protein TNCV_4071981 [Trichonephila clavipes]|uniref:Uncharacterized protein n=1 Tax=Trichonephila clavipes TaxID=2585209 RepID=A0A8X6W7U4_TRICX|nr:uncharacterized protein TNCV_4071981 [Trichonephila clavipes]
MSVGFLMLVIIEEIGEILKWYIDPIMVEMIIGGNYQNNRQGNRWFESRNRFRNDDRRFNDRGYQFRNRGQSDDFSRGGQRNRGSSEIFSWVSRKQMGRLNVLKVSDIKGESKIILDFDQKSLAIPDSKITKVVKTVEIEKAEIDLSKTKLEEKQKRELQDLFNSFQGWFSDKPGLTHVIYHEIDTGDNPLAVSRPYRHDRLKQEILEDIRARQHWVRELVITWKDEVGMSVGFLMLVIIEEIREILKWYIDQIMVEMIIGVTIRTTVKEIGGSRAGIGFKTMIADLTIGDINLEIEVKMTILVEVTKEIGVRVKILVGAVESKWDD